MKTLVNSTWFETLENRTLMSACECASSTFVYPESNNNSNSRQNAVLTDTANALAALPRGRNLKGGAGSAVAARQLSPSDSDGAGTAALDGAFLFAVNHKLAFADNPVELPIRLAKSDGK
jgi:hypothetical protein